MKLINILKNINYNGNPDDRDILSITHDSRKVKKGTLFIAISGDNNDGHDFIFEAVGKGATAIVANGRAPETNLVPVIQVKNPRKTMSKIAANFYNNPSKNLEIIGITGTNGKTTTTQIIDQILKDNNYSSSSLGSLGFNSPSGIISTGFTTPESIELQQILKTMKDGGINYVPMEISSHAIEMNRIDDLKVDIGIFTNLGLDHIDFHKTQEQYFHTKLKLFKKLNKDSTAILNSDDPYSNKIIKSIKCNHLTYGFNKNSDLAILDYHISLNSSFAKIKYNKKVYNISTNLIGKFNLYNIASAMLCCLKIGVKIEDIIYTIKNLKNVSGRFEKYDFPEKNSIAIIDYAHSPDAFENIFKCINEFKKSKKIITIFGCGGNRDQSKRSKMAKIADRNSDFIYLTEDNSRFEKLQDITNDILKGFTTNNYEIINDRQKAIEKALIDNDNSIFLILGKGVENYQLRKGVKYPHSDIEIVKNFINENNN